MEKKEVQCKSILNSSKLPASKYSINPYIGCQHGCVYCYARFMKRYTQHKSEWGQFVDIKINSPSILSKQLASSSKSYQGTIFFSSVTDAYQPLEQKYRITQELLRILLLYQLEISILTKSNGIIRDVNLLSQFKSCSIGVSITSLDETFRKWFEPHASPIKKRIDTLRVLHENGIETYVFIGPIFPLFTDIPQIIEKIKDYTDFVMAESLNYSCGNWLPIRKTFQKYYPNKLDQFQNIIKNPETWHEYEINIRDECQKYGIDFQGYFDH